MRTRRIPAGYKVWEWVSVAQVRVSVVPQRKWNLQPARDCSFCARASSPSFCTKRLLLEAQLCLPSWRLRWARNARFVVLISGTSKFRDTWGCEGFLVLRFVARSFWKFYSSAVCLVSVAQFVADGVFFAELNELLTRELAEDGYSGVEVRVTPMRTEIIIRATRTQNVLGESLGCTDIMRYGSGSLWDN